MVNKFAFNTILYKEAIKWVKKAKNQSQQNRLLVNPFCLQVGKHAGVLICIFEFFKKMIPTCTFLH